VELELFIESGEQRSSCFIDWPKHGCSLCSRTSEESRTPRAAACALPSRSSTASPSGPTRTGTNSGLSPRG
jgi:hypothetical protein